MIILNDRSRKNIDDCIYIAKTLPEFFNDDGIKKISKDIEKHDVYIDSEEGIVKGFATINIKSESIAEISWMAVDKRFHRNRTGSKIMDFMAKDLKEKGYKILEVKTLSHIVDYEPYKRTRNFYSKQGFMLLETIDPYPEWGPENPCDIYIKII